MVENWIEYYQHSDVIDIVIMTGALLFIVGFGAFSVYLFKKRIIGVPIIPLLNVIVLVIFFSFLNEVVGEHSVLAEIEKEIRGEIDSEYIVDREKEIDVVEIEEKDGNCLVTYDRGGMLKERIEMDCEDVKEVEGDVSEEEYREYKREEDRTFAVVGYSIDIDMEIVDEIRVGKGDDYERYGDRD